MPTDDENMAKTTTATQGECAASPSSGPLKTRDVIALWPGSGVGPGSENLRAQLAVTERSQEAFWPDRVLTGITKPNLTAFVPDRPNGAAVIVAPGGAYTHIVLDKEAAEMAHWLNACGVTVFVMQYRLPGEGHVDGKDVPLQDAQRAIRVLRQHAREWGLDPDRIGMLGASAGGHLAASLGANFSKEVYAPTDQADRLSARPDFLILLYPVITMDAKLAHLNSRTQLLGAAPSAALIKSYSPDQHVTRDSPRTFVVLANDDSAVPPQNGILYYEALRRVGVSAELHVFPEGEHGFGIRDARQLPVSAWPHLAAQWLKFSGIITAL